MIIVLILSVLLNIFLYKKLKHNHSLYNKDVYILQKFAYEIAGKYDNLRNNIYRHLN